MALLPTTDDLLHTTAYYCLRPTAYVLLPTHYGLRPATYCELRVARCSPPIADYIAPRPWLRTFTRVLLAPLLLGVSYPLGALGFLVLLSAGVFFRVRSRAQARASVNFLPI